MEGYTSHINHYLKNDADLSDVLPMNEESEDLFTKVEDGILLCKLINLAQPGAIDKRAIVVKKPLNIFNMNVNNCILSRLI